MAHLVANPINVCGACHNCCPSVCPSGSVVTSCCLSHLFPTTLKLDTTGGPMPGFVSGPLPAIANIPLALTYSDGITARYDLYYPASPYAPGYYPTGITGSHGGELVIQAYTTLCNTVVPIDRMFLFVTLTEVHFGGGGDFFYAVNDGGITTGITRTIACGSTPLTVSTASMAGLVSPNPATWTLHE